MRYFWYAVGGCRVYVAIGPIRFQSPKTCSSSSCGIGGFFWIFTECTSLKGESTRYVDLLLYIAKNTWTMYKTYGVLVAIGEVQGGRALARENAMSGD